MVIVKDIFIINNKEFDRKISPSDWRYSSAIVGMLRFFEHFEIDYSIENQYLYYNYDDVNNNADSKYLKYVEYRYSKELHHIILENLLSLQEKDDKVYDAIKSRLSGNTIMSNTFKGVNEKDNPETILDILDDNREVIIENTFKNAKYGYSKFSNTFKFRSESDVICRLNGYYVDTGRKTKSLGFGFDNNSRNYSDEIEFDFIPFGFTNKRESIFINNNFSVDLLLKTNNKIENELEDEEDNSFRSKLFYSLDEGSDYIDFDVEVILKDMDRAYFETIFIRKEANEIFKNIRKKDRVNNSIKRALRRRIKITDDYYINIMEEVTNKILNLVVLDELIIFLFNHNERDERNYGSLIAQLVKINQIIYELKYYAGGDRSMDYKFAYLSARDIKDYFKKKRIEHKLDSYRSKLISALSANDEERFFDIMLQLSSYSQTPINFMHELFKDFEKNKNVAYDFVNQLNYFEFKEKVESKEEN